MKYIPLRRFVADACDGPFGSAIKTENYAEAGARVIRLGNIGTGQWRDESKAFLSLDYWQQLSSHHARPGDIVMAGLGDEGHPVGRACIVPSHINRALVKADCYRLRLNPHLAEERFIAAFLSSAAGLNQAEALAEGSTRPRLTLGKAMSIRVPHIPVAEQRNISDFLDSEVGYIDALIAKKRRMVALVLDRSISRIFAAVRGAFEGGPWKQSGLDWLGDVPEEWPVMNVACQFEVLLGKMLNQERTSGSHLKPYLRNTNVQWDLIDTTDLLEMDFPPSEQSRFRVLPGDLLVCEGGEPGRAALWDGRISEIYYQKALHRIRPGGYSLVRWLFYCLRAATALNVFAIEGNATTIAHLTGEQLRSHRFAFPERAAQERLVAFLDKAGESDKKLVGAIERQVGLLHERRQALITATVTGELDVPMRPGVSVGRHYETLIAAR